MANEVSIIETVLTAKTDQHDKAIAASEKKLDDFGKNASDAGFEQWTRKISNDFDKLIKILGDTGRQAKSLLDPIEQAFKSLGVTSQASLDRMAKEARASFDLIRDSGKATTQDLQNAWNSYIGVLKKAQDNTEDMVAANKKIADSNNQVTGSTHGLSASLLAVGVSIGSLAAQAVSSFASMVRGAVEAGIGFNAMKETATVAFTQMLGSGTLAKKMLADLFEFAAKTPFRFEEVTAAAQKLKNVGFEAGQVIPILRSVGDAAAAAGKGSEGVDRITNALVQMKAKGKVSAEEMVQQLGEIVPAMQILADKMGISVAELTKKMSDGALDVDKSIALLVEGMNERFGGMMEAQSKTFSGLLSSLQDYAVQFMGSVMEPLFNRLRDLMQVIVTNLPEIQRAVLDAWTNILNEVDRITGDLQNAIRQAGSDILLYWRQHGEEIKVVAKAAWFVVSETTKVTLSAIAGIIRIGGAAITGNWNAVLNSLKINTESTMGGIVKFVGNAFTMLNKMSGGLGTVLDVAGKFSGPAKIDTSIFAQRFRESVANSLAKEEAGFVKAGTKVGGAVSHGVGKGAGGAKAAMAEMARESLAIVNEWLGETGQRINISKRDWDGLATNLQQNLQKQADAFEKNKTSTKEFFLQMKGGIITGQEMGDMFAKLATAANNAGTIIASALPKVSVEFIKVKDDVGGLEKAMKGLETAQEKLTKIAIKESEERAKAAEKEFRSLSKTYEDMGRNLPKSWNLIIDAIVQSSGKLGTALLQHGIKIKGWASDVMGVIDTMPGKWGDATRKIVGTIDQWITFADKILGLLSKISDSIPSNIGGVVDAIIGIFKSDKATSGVGAAVGGLVTSATQSATGAATAAGQAAGGAVTGGISSGLSSGVSTVTSAMTGIFSAITGAVATFAQTFQSDSKTVRFAGGFLLGGPIGGILSAIFGGPSQFEKEKRQLTLDKMKADIASVYEDIKGTMIDTMQKGLALLEGIADSNVIDLPRKAIKRFINKLGDILTLFVDLSKTFKGEALAQAKLVTDNLGGAIDLMLGGAELINAIQKVSEVSDEKIASFVKMTITIIEKWLAAASEIEIQSAKFANKLSTKLVSSVELISKFPELINAMVEAAKVTITDQELDVPFANARRIIDRFFQLADEFEGYALKRTAKAAEQFQQIFESGKSLFEFFKLWSDYKPADTSIFDAINADYDRVTNWFLSAIDKSTEWLGLSETLRDNILHLATEMSDISNAITGAFGGAGGGAQNFTVQQSTSNPLGLSAAAGSTGGGSTQTQAPVIINLNVNGSLIHQANLPNVLVAAFEEARKKGQIE